MKLKARNLTRALKDKSIQESSVHMSAAGPVKNLPPPSIYEESLTYAKQWRQHQHSPSHSSSSDSDVIFDLAFFHNHQKNSPTHLVGCTGSGELCIWNIPPRSTIDNDYCDMDDVVMESNEQAADLKSQQPSRKPICRLQVPTSKLYSVQIVARETVNDFWVVAAGNGGVWLYLWKQDIQPLLLLNGSKQNNKSHLPTSLAPRLHFSLHPSAYESEVEVNDTCIHNGRFLYGAAGDAFGCYKWDLLSEQLVTTYGQQQPASSRQRGYLQAVQIVPQSNLLLAGGHEGVLGLYDIEKDQAVDRLDIGETLLSSNGGGTNSAVLGSYTARRRSSAAPTQQQWISSIVIRDENWWTVAGGIGKSHPQKKNGFVSTWHGPTRSLISIVETRERPQKLALYGKNNEAILSVANEGFVSHYEDSLSLANNLPMRVRCEAPSAYAVEVALDQRIAVAGVGGCVNIYEEGSQLTITLRL